MEAPGKQGPSPPVCQGFLRKQRAQRSNIPFQGPEPERTYPTSQEAMFKTPSQTTIVVGTLCLVARCQPHNSRITVTVSQRHPGKARWRTGIQGLTSGVHGKHDQSRQSNDLTMASWKTELGQGPSSLQGNRLRKEWPERCQEEISEWFPDKLWPSGQHISSKATAGEDQGTPRTSTRRVLLRQQSQSHPRSRRHWQGNARD